MEGVDDLRDLWNQQTPFAIPKALQPLFLQRLKDSFADWDMRDGKAIGRRKRSPPTRMSSSTIFCLFDVAKPITDESHLEIEKSTIDGRPLPDRRRPHGRCELDRYPAHLARQPRSRVPPRAVLPGDETRHESISLFRGRRTRKSRSSRAQSNSRRRRMTCGP
jgi:hypothetical protein